MAVLLPRWSTDRWRRKDPSPERVGAPLVLYEKAQNALRIYALDKHAQSLGLFVGQALADARAMCPELLVAEADPAEDADKFKQLSERLIRYSPLVSVYQTGEALIDITGCQHLFGGEAAICADIEARFERAGFEAQIAIADTAGAAWGAAKYGRGGVVPSGGIKETLAPLPVEALRLEAPVADGLRRLGLKRVGQLYALPRAPLTARFKDHLLTRLGQALGNVAEPLTPLWPPPSYYADLKVAEPISSVDAVFECLQRLCETLSARLQKAGKGGRRFELLLFRVDNHVARISVGASQSARKATHMARLFKNKLDAMEGLHDAGFGFEQFRLCAFETSAVGARQQAMFDADVAEESLGELKDRLSNRLGAYAVCRLRLQDSHLPERAGRFEPVLAASLKSAEIKGAEDGPLKLLTRPEEIEALAQVPDGPPVRFKWRRVSYSVARASGPERIGDEWWRQADANPTRDYYRIETQEGRRYWIFREGLYERETATPKWYLHGFFA